MFFLFCSGTDHAARFLLGLEDPTTEKGFFGMKHVRRQCESCGCHFVNDLDFGHVHKVMGISSFVLDEDTHPRKFYEQLVSAALIRSQTRIQKMKNPTKELQDFFDDKLIRAAERVSSEMWERLGKVVERVNRAMEESDMDLLPQMEPAVVEDIYDMKTDDEEEKESIPVCKKRKKEGENLVHVNKTALKSDPNERGDERED